METPLFVDKHPFGVASVVWGTEFSVAEGLAWVERHCELCQMQLKTWHLSCGVLPK